jgi:hypothetical protein
MGSTMIVMMIWVFGAQTSGPAVLQGFSSLEDCQRAIPVLEKFYDKGNWREATKIECAVLE